MHIFQGGLVQKLNGLTAESRLFGFLFLLLFRRVSSRRGRGGTGMSHLDPKVFRDRGEEGAEVVGVYLHSDPHAYTPTSQGVAPAADCADSGMR